jgi:ferrochelatase
MIGVLAMAYGTPVDRDDIARYYTDIRRGSPPPADLLDDLIRRYDAIGGTFPLRRASQAQCAGLQRALDGLAPGGYLVALGCKHAPPTVEQGVADLAAAGVEGLVGLVLAPHYAAMSVGEYAARAARAAAQAGLPAHTVPDWHLLPAYLDFLAAEVTAGLARLPAGAEVVFTAHSLPARIVAAGDPYPDQLAATAGSVAALAGLANWSVGWQSAGRTGEAWLGPDVLEILADRAARGSPGVLVCPCGFVADHLEVAYDLDIAAAQTARRLGLPFARTGTVGADPAVLAGLAGVVVSRPAGRVDA